MILVVALVAIATMFPLGYRQIAGRRTDDHAVTGPGTSSRTWGRFRSRPSILDDLR